MRVVKNKFVLETLLEGRFTLVPYNELGIWNVSKFASKVDFKCCPPTFTTQLADRDRPRPTTCCTQAGRRAERASARKEGILETVGCKIAKYGHGLA